MTRPKLISDSPPLIALARIEELDLVPRIFREILVPDAVFKEVTSARTEAPGARQLANARWIRKASPDPLQVRPLRFVLDLGEAEAIALAQMHPGSQLLTDDRRARRVAEQLGIRFQGTLGMLGRAKRRGLISSVRSLTDRLQATGWRISESTLEEFLRRIGE